MAVPDFINGYGGMYAAYTRELFGFGLPEAYHFDAATAYTLTGNGAYALSEEQIMHILKTGVYMDSGALRALHALGFTAKYLGFSAGDPYPRGCPRMPSAPPVNIGMEGGCATAVGIQRSDPLRQSGTAPRRCAPSLSYSRPDAEAYIAQTGGIVAPRLYPLMESPTRIKQSSSSACSAPFQRQHALYLKHPRVYDHSAPLKTAISR